MKSKEFNSTSFEKYFEEKMKNEDFRHRWEDFQPEYQAMRVAAETGKESNQED